MWPSTRWSGDISWTEDFDHIYQNKIYFHLLPSKSNFKFCKGDFISCDGRPMWGIIITLLLWIFNMSNLFPENTSPNRTIVDNHVLLLRNHMCNEIYLLCRNIHYTTFTWRLYSCRSKIKMTTTGEYSFRNFSLRNF